MDRIAESFRPDGRVHIRDILAAESADGCITAWPQETDFSLLCRTGDDRAQAWRVASLTPQKEAELMNAAYARARDGFHYLYDGHALSREGEAYSDPSHYLAAIARFLNSTPLLDFARRRDRQSGNCLRRCAGHPLSPRVIFSASMMTPMNRDGSAAYVLNLTPRWRPDWGGALLFADGPGHISAGYLPAFNALNILAVPQEHLVGLVSPFAGAARYSITGWFRTR